MTPDQLCAIGDCRVVAFMFHDRVAFGGVLIAGVHLAVGYADPLHLAPALAGAALFVVGLVLVSERQPRGETRWHR